MIALPPFSTPPCAPVRATRPVAAWIFLTSLLILILAVYHFRLVTWPYQAELREGSMMDVTALMLDGQRPYDITTHPFHFWSYGFVVNWIAYLLAHVVGASTTLHRAIIAAAIFLTCVLFWLVLRHQRTPLPIRVPCVALLYSGLLYYVQPLARVDAVGLLCYLCAIYIPWLLPHVPFSLSAGLVLGLVAAHTKLYFILFIPIVGTHLLFARSWRVAFGYVGLAGALLVLTMAGVSRFYPAYLRNILVDVALGFSPAYLAVQASAFIVLYGALFILMGRWVARLATTLPARAPRLWAWAHDIHACALVFGAIACVRLCGNPGAFLNYPVQLLAPFLLASAARWCALDACLLRWSPPLLTANLLAATALLIGYPYVREAARQRSLLPLIDPRMSTRDIQRDWRLADAWAAHHTNMLNHPGLTSLLRRYRRPVYDNGQSEYFTEGLGKAAVLQRVFIPTDAEVLARSQQVYHWITNHVCLQSFDAITTPNCYNVPTTLLSNYYHPAQSITLAMPHVGQLWDVTLWLPRPRPATHASSAP